jgi:hypothetical protein
MSSNKPQSSVRTTRAGCPSLAISHWPFHDGFAPHWPSAIGRFTTDLRLIDHQPLAIFATVLSASRVTSISIGPAMQVVANAITTIIVYSVGEMMPSS